MNNIDGMKKRVDKLAEQDGGNIIMLYRGGDLPDDQLTERIHAERARGNNPIVLDAEDRDL